MFMRKKIQDVCSREDKYHFTRTYYVGSLPVYYNAGMHIINESTNAKIFMFSIDFKENNSTDYQIDFVSSSEYDNFVKNCSPELKKLVIPNPVSLAEEGSRNSGINYNSKNLNLCSCTIKIPNNAQLKILFEDVLMMIHKMDSFDLPIINKINEHFNFIKPNIIIDRLKSEISGPYNAGAAMGLFRALEQPIDPAPEVAKYLDIQSGANLAKSAKLFAKTASDASMLDLTEARNNMPKP